MKSTVTMLGASGWIVCLFVPIRLTPQHEAQLHAADYVRTSVALVPIADVTLAGP